MNKQATSRNDTPIYDATLEEVPFDLEAIRNRPRWDFSAGESENGPRGKSVARASGGSRKIRTRHGADDKVSKSGARAEVSDASAP